MDFLPAGWLVRVDDIHASMTMGQPFPGVWLPRDMKVHAGVTIASGPLEAAYGRKFTDYKLAETKTLIRIPKAPPPEPSPDEQEDGSGPFVAEREWQAEVVSEIRVHGNAYIRDDEVIRLAGVSLGQSLQPDTLRAIEQRLKASGFFETVEIRKRYRSLDSLTDVSIVLLVHEREGHTSELAVEPPSIWPWKRLKSRLMFLPILGYDDGYGLTYGGRVSSIGLLGMGERLSVPLSWGGTRRAALEFERTFKSGPLTRIASSVGIAQSENPRFEIDDRRFGWTARAERSFAGLVRTGVGASQHTVTFNPLEDRLWTLGADAALDTRGDPGFPRNAVYLGASWTGLHVDRLDEPINRYTGDARGYLGLIRQAVVAGRVEYLGRGSNPSAVRTDPSRRSVEPAWIRRRLVCRRSPPRHVSRAARADYVRAERRETGRERVRRRVEGLRRRSAREGCHLASRRRRRTLPHRHDRADQSRRRARREDRRHARAPVVGV